jgi:hypothetical protein
MIDITFDDSSNIGDLTRQIKRCMIVRHYDSLMKMSS